MFSFLKIGRYEPDVKRYKDDVFLVSYPKSGNTWMRFVLSNLLKKSSDETIDFHSAIDYVPELSVHNEKVNQLERPRIIKSHETYNKLFPKVVYLIRDPRDVYVSYYHYLLKRLPPGTTFKEFLRMDDLHPSRWHIHVKSWQNQPGVRVFKYETLLENPVEEVLKITEYIGLDKDSADVEAAVKASSFDKMKEIENKNGRPFKDEEAKKLATPFMRKGQKGDWKSYFSEDDIRFLWDEAGEVMKKYDYI